MLNFISNHSNFAYGSVNPVWAKIVVIIGRKMRIPPVKFMLNLRLDYSMPLTIVHLHCIAGFSIPWCLETIPI